MTDCLFCKIVRKEIPATIIFQDEAVLAFHDIAPQAPHHILVIPCKHIATINDFSDDDAPLIGKIMLTAKRIAKELKIDEPGYRVLMNCNKQGGQAVYHVHFHLLGGRQMQWPPG